MKILFWGTTLFSIAFLLHVIIWKIHVPKNQTKVLLQIFSGTLIVGLFALARRSLMFQSFNIELPIYLTDYVHIFLFYISMTLAYVTTYSAIEADSPSLVMIMTIYKAGKDGLRKDIFDRVMTDDILVKPRIRDLVADKIIYLEGNEYKLTPRGVLFARIFILYRKLLNAPKGG